MLGTTPFDHEEHYDQDQSMLDHYDQDLTTADSVTTQTPDDKSGTGK